MRRVLLILAASACSGTPKASTPSSATTAHAQKMSSFTLGDYTLTGAEYWPYAGSADIDYPKDVLWGFYPVQGVVPDGETDPNPATARPEAIACAEQAYAALRSFLASDPPLLRKIIAAHQQDQQVVPRFYL